MVGRAAKYLKNLPGSLRSKASGFGRTGIVQKNPLGTRGLSHSGLIAGGVAASVAYIGWNQLSKRTMELTGQQNSQLGLMGSETMAYIQNIGAPNWAQLPEATTGMKAAVGAMVGSAAAGGFAYNYLNSTSKSAVQVFDVAAANGTGFRSAFKRGAMRAGNATNNFFRHPGFAGSALGIAGSVGAMSIAARSVNRLATRMLAAGSNFKPAISSQSIRTSRRTSPTNSRIMRQAGDFSGVMATGNMVLDLHKTGGRGGVYR